MGKVYYDIGFLGTAEVIECSAKDLIGEYVGHTGPKAQKLIESALGKVLFVDEAYRLGEGPFAKEAIDELVDCITKPQFLNKIVIILAGYHHEINKMLEVNPGLTSRFSESVDFQPLTAESCWSLLQSTLQRKRQLDASKVSTPRAEFQADALKKLSELATLKNFANGRDIQTLCKRISGAIMKTKRPAGAPRTVTEGLVLDQIDRMKSERTSRADSASTTTGKHRTPADATLPVQTATQDIPAPKATATSIAAPALQQESLEAVDDTRSQATEEPRTAPQPQANAPPPQEDTPYHPTARDANVSDAAWNQLQHDAQLAAQEQREAQRLAEEEEKLRLWLAKCADAKRQRELEELERKKRELEEKLRREAEERAMLMQNGICPMGYHWIRQAGGYRCAGGSHWVGEGDVARLCGR